MNVARREARETHYWLRLIAADGLVPAERLADLAQEAEEVVRILTAIVKTARGA
jgi:four helix bundle protein